MRLTLREAAASLDCTEKTVLRWIAHAGLPTVRVGGLYHFNRAELMEWAIHHGIGPTALSCELEPEQPGDEAVSALAAALRAGGVAEGLPGRTLPEAMAAVAELLLPDAPAEDRALVQAMLMARETAGVTAVGGGVLAPHVRAPLILGETPRILLAYPAAPLPTSAVPTPDDEPVSALFVIASPTVRAHLTLLALLAAALRDLDFRQAVRLHTPLPGILAAAAAAERQDCARRRGQGGRPA